jgi:rhodanese-related sulfurtransferase
MYILAGQEMPMFGLLSRKSAPAREALPVAEIARRLRAGEILLVDVRERGEWDAGHIPGAELAPLSAFPALAPKLPTDRPVVLYCKGGTRSGQALALAARLGLPITAHMAGGITAWMQAGLPVSR